MGCARHTRPQWRWQRGTTDPAVAQPNTAAEGKREAGAVRLQAPLACNATTRPGTNWQAQPRTRGRGKRERYWCRHHSECLCTWAPEGWPAGAHRRMSSTLLSHRCLRLGSWQVNAVVGACKGQARPPACAPAHSGSLRRAGRDGTPPTNADKAALFQTTAIKSQWSSRRGGTHRNALSTQSPAQGHRSPIAVEVKHTRLGSPGVVVQVEGAQVPGGHALEHRAAAVHVQPACKGSGSGGGSEGSNTEGEEAVGGGAAVCRKMGGSYSHVRRPQLIASDDCRRADAQRQQDVSGSHRSGSCCCTQRQVGSAAHRAAPGATPRT